jgi:hypothetical protein
MSGTKNDSVHTQWRMRAGAHIWREEGGGRGNGSHVCEGREVEEKLLR